MYSAMKKKVPIMAKVMMNATRFDPMNWRVRNSPNSTIGAATRSSMATNAASPTRPAARSARIPPEVQPSLFKPYFTTKAQGTGMGLALTEKLVGQHGGRIEFRTGPQGTTFSMALPLEPAVGAKDPV